MIPKECKRLAEVDFPIAMVSKHAVREKATPRGHPSMLHLWWARRPLASSRAMLLALLLPDPCDPQCPKDFKAKAKKLLPQVGCGRAETDAKLREGLLKFIGDFANWDFAANATYLEVVRGLVKAAYPEETPLVVDPFAGGGSIPLEALRLGCDAFASDLNPVACLILKMILEDIPRQGPELAEELRKAGAEIKRQAEKDLAELYPPDPDGSRPIAYLWSRTVQCEAPNCGAEIPIFKSAWMSKKGVKRARYFREAKDGTCVGLLIDSKPVGGPVTFRIARGYGSEDPQSGFSVLLTTKAAGNNANVVCPCCGGVLSGSKKSPRTSAQLAAQRGGADVTFDTGGHRSGGTRLLAVVTVRPGETGRRYRLPIEGDYEAVWRAHLRLAGILAAPLVNGLSAVPDEPLPPIGTLGFRVQRYGILSWGDLFTARQKVALAYFAECVASVHAQGLRELLAAAYSRVAMSGMSCTRWNPGAEKMQHTFGRQALPIVWDFAEVVPIVRAPGNWESGYELAADAIDAFPTGCPVGQVAIADATEPVLPEETASVWFTDPPYYDAIPYSDLSDFFFVGLKRALPRHTLLKDPFDAANPLTPKAREAVQDDNRMVGDRPKDRAFFEEVMGKAFSSGRRSLREDGIAAVVFAHKTTEGWEALLSGMVSGGWTITASWPIATEMQTRLRARDSAALATSVHLVCRPRSVDTIGDWGEVLRELPKRVAEWMQRLQSEHVRGADLVFACIGPALEIFSRYATVETADGREVALAEYLEKVWEVVGRSALEQILGGATGGAGALEEDARLTALFLWTLQSSNGASAEASDDDEESDDEEDEAPKKKKAGGYSLVFDVARRFAQPLGIHLPDWEGRIIETEKGVVRLLPVAERAKQLFGEDGMRMAAAAFERNALAAPQLVLFPEEQTGVPNVKGRGRKKAAGESKAGTAASAGARREATTLDRVHAAMLLQRSGQSNGLRALLSAEQDRGPDFLRLANALSALYPRESEEKRLLDAMLLAVSR